MLKEVLSSTSSERSPDFGSTRESILQVSLQCFTSHEVANHLNFWWNGTFSLDLCFLLIAVLFGPLLIYPEVKPCNHRHWCFVVVVSFSHYQMQSSAFWCCHVFALRWLNTILHVIDETSLWIVLLLFYFSCNWLEQIRLFYQDELCTILHHNIPISITHPWRAWESDFVIILFW